MESTVQPERKLMLATLRTPKVSRMGLISTPPPMPHMAPATEARKLTMAKITYRYRFITLSPS